MAIVVHEANRIPQLNKDLDQLNKDLDQLNIRIAIANTSTSDNNQLLRQMTGMANELDLKRCVAAAASHVANAAAISQQIADTKLQIQKHDSLQQLKNHIEEELTGLYHIETRQVDDPNIDLKKLIEWSESISRESISDEQDGQRKRGIIIPILTMRLLLDPKMTDICHDADRLGVRFLPVLFEESTDISTLTRTPWHDEVFKCAAHV